MTGNWSEMLTTFLSTASTRPASAKYSDSKSVACILSRPKQRNYRLHSLIIIDSISTFFCGQIPVELHHKFTPHNVQYVFGTLAIDGMELSVLLYLCPVPILQIGPEALCFQLSVCLCILVYLCASVLAHA